MTQSIQTIDINCDMGEGAGNDHLIMPLISSANIACGYHAGDEKTIWQTIELALKHNVEIGAHVSFLDKENFGRSELDLSVEEIYELVTQQLIIFREIADSFDIHIHHIKPHGALYNQSARDPRIAKYIARAVKDFNPELLLFGLSGSHSITEASSEGLKTVSEVFADRNYEDDGSLTARSNLNALHENEEMVASQAENLVLYSQVNSCNGKKLNIKADSICIHGDGEHAFRFAKAINDRMKQHHIAIKAI